MTSLGVRPQETQGYWEPRPAAANHAPARDEQEREMVARAKAGEDEAFDWLYQRYHTAIFNYVYRMVGDQETAKDLTADAFLKLWLNLEKYVDRGTFGAWVYRLATNVCLDHLRHVKLVKWTPWEAFVSVFHPTQVAASREQPERIAVHREDTEEVRMLLSQLHPTHRACLVLREYYDLTYDEMAEHLGATRAAVKSLLYRARGEFRHLYTRSPRRPGRTQDDPIPEYLTSRERTATFVPGDHFGSRLIARRTALGLSQSAVGRLLGFRGHGSLSILERTGQGSATLKERVHRVLDEYEAQTRGGA